MRTPNRGRFTPGPMPGPQARPNGPLVLGVNPQAAARDPRALRALIDQGRKAFQAKDMERAAHFFTSVLAVAPDNADAHFSIGVMEMELKRFRRAQEHFLKALKKGAHLAHVQLAYADACLMDGQTDKARTHIDKALAINPADERGLLMRVDLLEQTGELDAAAELARSLIGSPAVGVGAMAHLATARRFKGDEPEIGTIKAAFEASSDSSVRQRLGYALGKIHNDIKAHDAAFTYYKAAADTFGTGSQQAERDREQFQRIRDAYRAIADRIGDGLGHDSEAPIFIVGMPRSGTTLTEQILASHPAVQGVGEQGAMGAIGRNLEMEAGNGANHLDLLPGLSAEKRRILGQTYLNTMKAYGVHPRYADKMPHNFLRVGLIRLLFPNARIIHCRRDPLDNCVSIFLNPLNEAHAYAHDLATLGAYYRLHHELMAFWRDEMKIAFFDCAYEETVADLETQARALVAHAGLPWDDRCLDFHKAETRVATISKWQVRQPIYTSSVKRWKAYERHLGPLIAALGDLAVTD